MSKLITNTIRHTGGSADNITLTSGGHVLLGDGGNDNAFFKAHAADGEASDQYVGQFINAEATAGVNYGVNIQGGSNSTDHGLRVKNHAGTSQLLVRGDGEVQIGSGDIVFGTAGKGIVLGSTSNTDANTLEDYEFGTWTPSFNALSTGSMTTNYAKYVKIGHLVQVTFYVSCSSTSSNEFQMSMPFSNNTSNGSWNVIPIQSNGSTVPLIGRIDENSTLMRVITSWSSNSNGDSKQSYNDLNGEWIIGAGTYHTDS